MFSVARSLEFWMIRISKVATTDHGWDPWGSPGRKGAERARPAKIEVLFCPLADYCPSFLKGQGYMRKKIQ